MSVVVLKLENEFTPRGNALLVSLSPRRGEGRGEGCGNALRKGFTADDADQRG